MRSKKKLTLQEFIAEDVRLAVAEAVRRFDGDRQLWHKTASDRYTDFPEWRTIYDYMSRNSYRDASIYESLKRGCELSLADSKTPIVDRTATAATVLPGIVAQRPSDDDDRHFHRFWRPTVGGTMLDLTTRRVDDRWLQLLASRTERFILRSVRLANTKITNNGMRHLSELDNLESLALDHTSISDISPLTRLKRLECLYLAGTEIGNDSIKFLRRFKILRVLSLSHTKVGSDGIKQLKSLKNLQKLWLYHLDEAEGSTLSIGDLKPILGLKSLQVLCVTGSRIGDEGVRMIANHLSSLKELYIDETGISDDGVEHLLKLKRSLQAISLSYNSPITYRSMEILAVFNRLRRLHLSGMMVDADSVFKLAHLPLAELWLENTSIKDKATKTKLHKAFPAAEIIV